MNANSDLIDLFTALNAEGADYLIVGGYAFAVHGRVRATKHIDIFIGTDSTNAVKVWRALKQHAWANRVALTYGGISVTYIGKEDFIKTKKPLVVHRTGSTSTTCAMRNPSAPMVRAGPHLGVGSVSVKAAGKRAAAQNLGQCDRRERANRQPIAG